ncbi:MULTISPECIES: molecular chaperone HtpG [Clostridium]|uniref:molecular chaperone HtpG n=2 Tax=Clostridiaceae TaxID=31979 RepID=UPI00066769E1|nr:MULTISPECIES: molecular chaperone HtpG [Clostridium]MBS7129478.1 molecular chaperone HtpG [Clostridium sp.]MDB2094342.1 molecular chaperone HtpG [Clostridium paraputrificum]MDB2098584.1 molecular chaperone HtpG [Clostridium paraputrificum]MDB2106904.1 molecular chaperone HtpG [Clostridium paraputrificum]MDB2113617.1 molecular chaperone HtpG [Clostridium paraputrificum]
MSIEKGNISIHTENIFPIIKKWLYSDKDIFIRELISNGCDAVSKYKRLVSLGEAEGIDDEKFKVVVSVNKEEGTLTFSDNGIGMTDEEVKKYITQVAFSGAEDFIQKYKDKMGEGNDIIGHFGLGFYSAFMVAKKVQIDTLSYKKEATPVRWICEGGTEYEMGDSDSRETRGTTITLFLDDESKEFLEYYKVRGIIEKYCSFLPTEIFLINVDEEKKKSEEDKDKDGEPTPLNDTNPLWLKKPSECTDEEYKEFYKQVFNEYEDPLFWIHLNVDYPFNLKGILYFPKLKNEFELIEGKVKLYNNQVFVADNIKEVIPEFLLLLKGAIDCPDLPLNVSRSFLQNDRDVSRISKHIVKKVADKLNSIFNNDRDKFDEFWDDIHLFIKFGCLKDESFYEKIKDIIVFKNIEGKHITLKDYLENAKEKHENKVFYVSNEEEQSQYIKLFKEYELDALILSSPIDNNFISFLEYKDGNVKFTRVDSDLSDVLKDKDAEEDKENNEKIIELFKSVIGDKMKEYKVESLKNEKTPAMVLLSEYSRRMAEMQAQFGGMGMNIPEEKSLVINGNNPIIKKLASISDDESKKDKVNIICKQIVDLALISNKSLNSDELDEFINRTNDLMLQVMDI